MPLLGTSIIEYERRRAESWATPIKAENIENGHVLQMRSGGPHLTVVSVNDKTCECCWFDTRGHLLRSTFQFTALWRPV